jgi:hypothetical protein
MAENRNFLNSISDGYRSENGYHRYRDFAGNWIGREVGRFVGDGSKNTLPELIELSAWDIFDGDGNGNPIPVSTREHYRQYNDLATDYFKHGLYIDGISRLYERPPSDREPIPNLLDTFDGTSFENEDPVIFGFDIILDAASSPLLNGSVLDFIRNYSNISEIASREPVYENFKNQLSKFFKTNIPLTINELTEPYAPITFGFQPKSYDNSFNAKDARARLAYYIKSIKGLDKLSENNDSITKKYLADYNKDFINLTFSEDLTLNVGTLAHLYKLLYWSKPNGKGLIPENLLRFNCDIVVSEVRNYKRIAKILREIPRGDTIKTLEVIKDNVSRYIYSLKECQFYFKNLPHDSDIDMGNIKTFTEGAYSITFDYKYSTSRLERFMPDIDGFGSYVKYDGGAIWRIATGTERDTSIGGASVSRDTPRFFTRGDNSLQENGIDNYFSFKSLDLDSPLNDTNTDIDESNFGNRGSGLSFYEDNFDTPGINAIRAASNQRAKLIAQKLKRDAANFVISSRVDILNRSLNKLLNSLGISRGISPPINVYEDLGFFGGILVNNFRALNRDFLNSNSRFTNPNNRNI